MVHWRNEALEELLETRHRILGEHQPGMPGLLVEGPEDALDIAALLFDNGYGNSKVVPGSSHRPIEQILSCPCERGMPLGDPPKLLEFRTKGIGAPPPCGGCGALV